MIKFRRIVKRLAAGNMLEASEIKYIKGYLGYCFGLNHLMGLVLLGIFTLIFIGLLAGGLLIYSIIAIVLGLGCLFYYAPFFPKTLKKSYDAALEEYLKINLGNKSLIYTNYLVQSGFPINKNKVYFIYDGYYFKIQEDLLLVEEPKKNIFFKYPDQACGLDNSLEFKLQEIISYEGEEKNLALAESTLQDLVLTNPDSEPNFRINLNNFKSISLGANIYPYFKALIKEKEK